MSFRLLTSNIPRRVVSSTLLHSNNVNMNRPVFMTKRFMSLIDLDDELNEWPKEKTNSVLNICPQGYNMVVERLGKLHSIQNAGWFVAIPLVDSIKYVVDMREKALSIAPQTGITKDNVHVKVSGNLYCQFVDPNLAAYGSKNPLYAVKQHAQSAMRAALGEMELDEILHARAKLNGMIRESVQESAKAWGLEIKRYEITDISPDKFITEAMDKQAAAERDRRKKVLDAEGDKRSAELESEGQKIKFKNESEGRLIAVTNEAEARKRQLLLEAEGEAEAIMTRSKAQAEAIKILAETLSQSKYTEEAAKLTIAREYISMYGDIGQKSNTMIFNERPADFNALMAQATSILKATEANSTKKTTE